MAVRIMHPPVLCWRLCFIGVSLLCVLREAGNRSAWAGESWPDTGIGAGLGLGMIEYQQNSNVALPGVILKCRLSGITTG